MQSSPLPPHNNLGLNNAGRDVTYSPDWEATAHGLQATNNPNATPGSSMATPLLSNYDGTRVKTERNGSGFVWESPLLPSPRLMDGVLASWSSSDPPVQAMAGPQTTPAIWAQQQPIQRAMVDRPAGDAKGRNELALLNQQSTNAGVQLRQAVLSPLMKTDPRLALRMPAKDRSTRARVKRACQSCKQAKTRCDKGRPCQRCIRTGKEATCVDSVHRKRGRRGSFEDDPPMATFAASQLCAEDFIFEDVPFETCCRIDVTNEETIKDFVRSYVVDCLESWHQALFSGQVILRPGVDAVQVQRCKTWLSHLVHSLSYVDKSPQVPQSPNISSELDSIVAVEGEAAMLKETSKHLPVGVFVSPLFPSTVCGPDLKLRSGVPWANLAAAHMLGFTREQLFDIMSSMTSFFKVCPLRSFMRLLRYFLCALACGVPSYSLTTEWVNASGTTVNIQVSATIKYFDASDPQLTGYPHRVVFVCQPCRDVDIDGTTVRQNDSGLRNPGLSINTTRQRRATHSRSHSAQLPAQPMDTWNMPTTNYSSGKRRRRSFDGTEGDSPRSESAMSWTAHPGPPDVRSDETMAAALGPMSASMQYGLHTIPASPAFRQGQQLQ